MKPITKLALFGLVIVGIWLASVWLIPQRLVNAQVITGDTWCNAYLDPAWLPEAMLEPGGIAADLKPLRIKYGKGFGIDQYGPFDAFKWWIDLATAPDEARNKRLMYFYPIEKISSEDITKIVESVIKQVGNEKPLFAMAVSTHGLKQSGVDVAGASESELFATPIWWNEVVAGTMKAAASGYSKDPTKAKSSLAHMVGYTVAFSATYDPNTKVCNPNHVPDISLGELIGGAAIVKAAYLGVSHPIESLAKVETPVLMTKKAWPTKD